MGVKKDCKYIGFYVPAEEHKKLREFADIEQCATVNRLVREIVKKALREYEKQTA